MKIFTPFLLLTILGFLSFTSNASAKVNCDSSCVFSKNIGSQFTGYKTISWTDAGCATKKATSCLARRTKQAAAASKKLRLKEITDAASKKLRLKKIANAASEKLRLKKIADAAVKLKKQASKAKLSNKSNLLDKAGKSIVAGGSRVASHAKGFKRNVVDQTTGGVKKTGSHLTGLGDNAQNEAKAGVKTLGTHATKLERNINKTSKKAKNTLSKQLSGAGKTISNLPKNITSLDGKKIVKAGQTAAKDIIVNGALGTVKTVGGIVVDITSDTMDETKSGVGKSYAEGKQGADDILNEGVVPVAKGILGTASIALNQTLSCFGEKCVYDGKNPKEKYLTDAIEDGVVDAYTASKGGVEYYGKKVSNAGKQVGRDILEGSHDLGGYTIKSWHHIVYIFPRCLGDIKVFMNQCRTPEEYDLEKDNAKLQEEIDTSKDNYDSIKNNFYDAMAERLNQLDRKISELESE